MAEKKPLFVNLQTGAVSVYDESNRPVTVQPWANRNRKTFGGKYIVAGAHYAQFVGKMGPLYVLPKGEKFNPSLLPEDAEAPEAPKPEPDAPKQEAPKKPEPPKEPDAPEGKTGEFPDGASDEGTAPVDAGGSGEAGEDAGEPAEEAPKKGKVKVKGKGKK